MARRTQHELDAEARENRYRVTSLIRNCPSLGTNIGPIGMVLLHGLKGGRGS